MLVEQNIFRPDRHDTVETIWVKTSRPRPPSGSKATGWILKLRAEYSKSRSSWDDTRETWDKFWITLMPQVPVKRWKRRYWTAASVTDSRPLKRLFWDEISYSDYQREWPYRDTLGPFGIRGYVDRSNILKLADGDDSVWKTISYGKHTDSLSLPDAMIVDMMLRATAERVIMYLNSGNEAVWPELRTVLT